MAVPTDTLADSDGPLLEVVQLGPLAIDTKVFAAIALFALANGALINMIMASRLIYGMGSRGSSRARSARPPTRRTPWVGDHLHRRARAGPVVVGDLETLADTTVLLLLFVFIGVNVAVLVLRSDPVDHDHWHAPTVLPILGAIAAPG